MDETRPTNPIMQAFATLAPVVEELNVRELVTTIYAGAKICTTAQGRHGTAAEAELAVSSAPPPVETVDGPSRAAWHGPAGFPPASPHRRTGVRPTGDPAGESELDDTLPDLDQPLDGDSGMATGTDSRSDASMSEACRLMLQPLLAPLARRLERSMVECNPRDLSQVRV